MSAPGRGPRHAALLVLHRWDVEKRLFVEHLLREQMARERLAERDRRLLTDLCYGVVRHRNTLRAVSEHYCHRPLRLIPRTIRVAISVGLYQLMYLKTPPHAAVSTTIEAWKRTFAHADRAAGRASVGLLNAVLRRAAAEIEHVPGGTTGPEAERPDTVRGTGFWIRIPGLALPPRGEHLPRMLGIKHSHPVELVRVWLERFGEEQLLEILEHDNRPPPTTLVLRRGGPSAGITARKLKLLGYEAEEIDDPPQCVNIRSHGAIEDLPGYGTGDFWVQDVTSQRLAALLPEREHACLLDLCAAPGGKLAYLLDRRMPEHAVVCDVSEKRLEQLAENVQRLRFDARRLQVTVLPRDPGRIRLPRSFDQVLVDAPCSNTGVLARRHEARWRYLPEALRALHLIQRGLLDAAARHLAPGGNLLYCTCSIEPSENEEMIQALLRRAPELRLVEEVLLLPGSDGGDGGYGALLERHEL